jgi:hypothetical protein
VLVGGATQVAQSVVVLGGKWVFEYHADNGGWLTRVYALCTP